RLLGVRAEQPGGRARAALRRHPGRLSARRALQRLPRGRAAAPGERRRGDRLDSRRGPVIASRLLLNSILRAGFVACALLPLLASAAGCRVVVEDEKGRKKLDTDSVDQLKETGRELRQAGRELRQAGRQLRQVGRQVGEAGRQAGKAVSPV